MGISMTGSGNMLILLGKKAMAAVQIYIYTLCDFRVIHKKLLDCVYKLRYFCILLVQ